MRLHAERSYHLSSVAREVMPKFAAMTDREVLAGPFKLADAQELLAWYVTGKLEAFTRSERATEEHEEALIGLMIVDARTGALAVFDFIGEKAAISIGKD